MPSPQWRRRSTAESVHPVEGAAAAAVADARVTSLATLLASHILSDGELVLLVLKPSIWFIFFNSLMFGAAAILIGIAMAVLDHRMHDHFYFELVMSLIVGRLMVSTLQWMGRLYILTDMRVLRVNGVFNVDVFDCPLRKVVRTRLVSNVREKAVGVGSIEIIPKDESMPTAIWQTISRPVLVHERLQAAINRAKQSGLGCD